jgi:hypothetical protein
MVGDFFAAALRAKVLDSQVRFSAPQESFAPVEPPPPAVDPGAFSAANGGSAPGFAGGVPAEAMVGGPSPAPQPVVSTPVQPAPAPAARIINIPPMEPQQGTRIIGIPPQRNP